MMTSSVSLRWNLFDLNSSPNDRNIAQAGQARIVDLSVVLDQPGNGEALPAGELDGRVGAAHRQAGNDLVVDDDLVA